MRTALDVLRSLADRGLTLRLKDGRPVVEAPAGLVCPEDRRTLFEGSEEIAERLQALFDRHNALVERFKRAEAYFADPNRTKEEKRCHEPEFGTILEDIADVAGELLALGYEPDYSGPDGRLPWGE